MKTKLNQKLWNGDTMKPEVQAKLLKIAKHFYDFLRIDAPIRDIRITGSNSNFNYTPESDIDLHLHFDFDELGCSKFELAQNFFNTKKDLYNSKHNITVKGHRVELYSQDIHQPHHSSGEYSILFDRWIKKPIPHQKEKDISHVDKKSKKYEELIINVIGLEDENLKMDLAKRIKKRLHQKRKHGLASGGEMSDENLLYKRLRNSVLGRLNHTIVKSTDKKLSLEQIFKSSNTKKPGKNYG